MDPTLSIRLLILLFALSTPAQAAPLALNLRSRVETAAGSGRYHSLTKEAKWDASKTAIVICDMWDDHYCRNSAKRVEPPPTPGLRRDGS